MKVYVILRRNNFGRIESVNRVVASEKLANNITNDLNEVEHLAEYKGTGHYEVLEYHLQEGQRDG